jgi:hypothetical protein
LKGSKEYNTLVTLTGLAIGLVWVAKDEYTNPKWTGVPKANQMDIDELSEWNKQFGPADVSQWAIPADDNAKILQSLAQTRITHDDEISEKETTW